MLKKRIWEILELSKENDKHSKYFDYFISILILLNVVAIILETEKTLVIDYKAFFKYFELFSIFIFSVEYLLRLWSCVSAEVYKNTVIGRIKYLFSPLAIIDLIAIAPFYMTFFVIDTRILRILRLLRLLRITKHFRYSKTFHIIISTIEKKKEELLSALVLMLCLLLVCSTGVYFAENEAQPDKFPNIIETCWWAVITLTTIGYGEVTPKTGLGKIIGGLVSVLCVGLVALPTAILSAGMIEKLHRTRNSENALIEGNKNIELDSLRQEISEKIEAIDEKLNELIKKIES